MKKIKQFVEEKIILSAIMCVLLAVVLITATYSWYTIKDSVELNELELKTAPSGGIKVAIEKDGEDIMSAVDIRRVWKDDSLVAIIPINLGEFENIEEGRIAPGAYGPLPFYITSLSEGIRSYSIKVKMVYNPGSGEVPYELDIPTELVDRFLDLLTNDEKEALLNGLTDEEEERLFAQYTEEEKEEILAGLTKDVKDRLRAELAGKDVDVELTKEEKKKIAYVESMIMDHFSIYQKKYVDPKDDIVKFSDPLTFYINESDEVEAATGDLPYLEEVPVELYWVWNYELTDIPDYEKLKRFTDKKKGFGFDLRRDENGEAVNEFDTRKAIRKYDEEDTELGNYLDCIWFMVYIEGSPVRYGEDDLEE